MILLYYFTAMDKYHILSRFLYGVELLIFFPSSSLPRSISEDRRTWLAGDTHLDNTKYSVLYLMFQYIEAGFDRVAVVDGIW